jgi:hypothetical protein
MQNRDLKRIPHGARISVRITPVGEAVDYPPFVSKLGTLTKAIIPLSYFDWRKVPKELKRQLIRELKVIGKN